MGDMLHLEEQKHDNDSFLQALNEQFNDTPELQYFKAKLRGFPRSKLPEQMIASTNTKMNDYKQRQRITITLVDK